MIREAERTDKDKLFELYRMLVPNNKKMIVLEEQIETIRRDPNNTFIFKCLRERHREVFLG